MDRNIFSTEISSAILSFFVLMKFCSKYFIIMAMGAIGLHTDIIDLIKMVVVLSSWDFAVG